MLGKSLSLVLASDVLLKMRRHRRQGSRTLVSTPWAGIGEVVNIVFRQESLSQYGVGVSVGGRETAPLALSRPPCRCA